MSDVEIIALIEKRIADLASQDMKKFSREIATLIKLRGDITQRIDASLNHQASQAETIAARAVAKNPAVFPGHE